MFEAGLEEHDNTLILAQLDDVRAFAPLAQGASGLRLRFTDALKVGQFMPAVRARALGRPATLRAATGPQENASYFRAIRIEKTMMALILLLIVAVAAFNIVAMLVMVVNDKRTDIAILRTFGASPRAIMQTFITQGLAIGWLGVAAGVALGVLLALQRQQPSCRCSSGCCIFSFSTRRSITSRSIPSEVHLHDVAWISAAAFAADAAVDHLSGAARRGDAAGRRAALRVDPALAVRMAASAPAICARRAGAASCRSSRWSRRSGSRSASRC